METLFKLLSDAQASLFVLFHKTWVYHWNVVGKDFQQLHTLFGSQYETIFEEIDRLSEHMRYLNVKPLSSLKRVLEVSKIDEASSSANADAMISDLLQSNIDFCDIMSQISEEAEKQKSYATANLVQDLMESHGKFVWMLRSFSDNTSKKVEETFVIDETESELNEIEYSEDAIEESIEE
jgi:starvation-inducible DNA-binding protein